MGLVRLLQLSDLHLGRAFGWLPAERRQVRRREQREALELGVREAIERGVHAILVPGDLFDEEGVDADALAATISTFEIAGCPPVFIAPGNHDPYSPASRFWNARLLKASRNREWPAHVHVFREPEWTPAPLSDDVRVWGRCYLSKVSALERPLAAERLRDVHPRKNGIEIAVFHGSREGHLPPGQTAIAPFADEEALASPFTYLAAGHYHAGSRLAATGTTAAGVRLAYAGSAVGLDATELGEHGALEVRVEHGHRLPFVEVEFVRLDRRKAHDLAVEVTGCSSAERVDRRIAKALDEAGAGEDDLVTVRLAGRLARDVRYEPARELAERVFHLRLDRRRLRPDYPLDSYRRRDPVTTEDRFARALLERLDQAVEPAERARLESALYYGLDAFRLKEVAPVYEELE
jgi:DNA repair exonuclease SbcCD nuclease subunit